MIDAGDDPQFGNGPDIVRHIYQSMIAAAPSPVGLSQWAGWRDWNHQRSVCAAAFGPAWSLEDESTLIDFITRTWGATTQEAS
jgi:hypothetical protein